MSPIERAARALAALADDSDWQIYEQDARAVLQAIREPSEGMVASAVQIVGDPGADNWALAERVCEQLGSQSVNGETACAELARDWQAMIDAALSE